MTRGLVVATLLFMTSVAMVRDAGAAVIFVTTLEQKIGGPGCSLQEAIYSANFDLNVAINGYGSPLNFHDHAPRVVATDCVPGHGDDIIVLPSGAVFDLSKVVDDADNPMGPTATPMITSNITIEAQGATLQYVPTVTEVCDIFIVVPCTPASLRAFAVGPTGHLTIRNAYVKDFRAQGGHGSDGGGGGGMGAGGAIYVKGGGLVIENSTFDRNGAAGGNGGGPDGPNTDPGGGGGGLAGPGGPGSCAFQGGEGGGGGGSRSFGIGSCAGDGGGTVFDAQNRVPGFDCGGPAGNDDHPDGFDAPCEGGGGGGGWNTFFSSGDGGKGAYGGGGGGGAGGGGNGGDGGVVGGGGGGGWSGFFGGTRGGKGGFGGGGGAGPGGTVGDGDPGKGGRFGGDANAHSGGGGAGLGGAIFNDSGSVVVRNSTFTRNFAVRGVGGGADTSHPAHNGADAGGAIFSRNGRLTVQNATIANNESTGFGGGVVVVADPEDVGTLFVLENTIVFHNGSMDDNGNLTASHGECSIMGSGVTGTFAGNLIENNDNCPGVVTTGDPRLGPLQRNQGLTPTMAIPKTSAAFNAADSATSLARDQRGQTRPENGGFDIGAYELCLQGPAPIQFECLIVGGNQQVDTAPLTIEVSPTSGGTTNPAPGTYNEDVGSVVPLAATANPGYVFSNWSANVAVPSNASTTIVITPSAQVVTAFFVPGPTSLGGNILTKSGPQNARVWPINVANSGPGVALGTQISTFTLTQTFGAACTPQILTPQPVLVGDLPPAGSATVNLTIDFSSCAATSRFTAQAAFSANGGAATGSMTRTNQFP
jgi:hypothetical protein